MSISAQNKPLPPHPFGRFAYFVRRTVDTFHATSQMRLLFYIWHEEVHELLSPVRLASVDFRHHTARCQYYDKILKAIYATAVTASLLIYVALAPSCILVAHWTSTGVPKLAPWFKQVYSALHVKAPSLRMQPAWFEPMGAGSRIEDSSNYKDPHPFTSVRLLDVSFPTLDSFPNEKGPFDL